MTWGPRSPQQAVCEVLSLTPSPSSFPGWSFSMGSAYQFHSWRVFVIVCALPCVSSVVALTFMPESPRFLLEVTLILINTQRSHRHWDGFLSILGEYIGLFKRDLFPSCYGTMEGLVLWRPASSNHVKKLPRGQKALMFLLQQVIPLNEDDMGYCFRNEIYNPKVLFLVRGASFQLRCSRISVWSVCSSRMNQSAFALLHLICSTNSILEDEGVCMFHLLALYCLLIFLRLENMMKPG